MGDDSIILGDPANGTSSTLNPTFTAYTYESSNNFEGGDDENPL